MKQVLESRPAKVVLVNPPLVGLINDPFGSIPSLPVGIPYIAGYLRHYNVDVQIVDAFGEKPKQIWYYKGKYQARGLTVSETIERIPKDATIVGISLHSGVSFTFTMEVLKAVQAENRKGTMHAKVAIGGNFATAVWKEFIDVGADFVIIGEGEESFLEVIRRVEKNQPINDIDGLAWQGGYNPKTKWIKDLDTVPFPAIDMLPLKNYWDLGYAHGPFEGPYTFMMTSRGCPYGCKFCSTPTTWARRWRSHSPQRIADEMEYFSKTMGIKDFHLQDDIFTVNTIRAKEICREIIKRKLDVTWQILSTKAETVDEELVHLLKQAGCDYLSVSPETGSPELIKKMNKPFDYDHMLRITKVANQVGLPTQACFILGFPGETDHDRNLTQKYVAKLARAGIDEIGVYITTPLPGAAIYDEFKGKFQDHEESASYSPRWRSEYKMLNRFRQKLYLTLLFNKLLYHPQKMLGHVYHLLTGSFKVKIEAGLVRYLKTLAIGERSA